MVIDRYTKTVLSVIAACLLWQCVMSVGRVADAQGPTVQPVWGAQPVVIVGWGESDGRGSITVRTKNGPKGTVSDPQLPYTNRTPLPVGLAEVPTPVVVSGPVTIAASPRAPVPVRITGVRDATGEWDPIRAKVEPEGTRKGPGEP
jgi:hypothetical protein